MLISENYRQLNKQLHQDRPDYGTSGHKWAEAVNSLVRQANASTVLDYGCGKGTLGHHVEVPVALYDPCIDGLSAAPEPADIVACTDVLEHIEPECIYGVLDDLRRVTLKAGLFVVATRPAKKALPDGRNAHVLQRPPVWWCENMWERFEVAQFNDLGGEIVFIVRPKAH